MDRTQRDTDAECLMTCLRESESIVAGCGTVNQRSTKRRRILLLAEEANPEWVSVPLVGWSLYRALARQADVHLVTQVRNRLALLRAGLTEGVDFTAINSERIAAPVYRAASLLRGGTGNGWTTVLASKAISYPYFEHLVWRQFGRQIRAGRFDLVHRVTPVSPTLPSSVAPKLQKAGVPFVLGPLNGGLPWPHGFDAVRRIEKEWLSYVREAYRLLPGYRATRRCASVILLGSHDTWKQMPANYRSKCVYLPENGIDPDRFFVRRHPRESGPIRGIFVGRLVFDKGVDMALEAAVPLLRDGSMTLEIVGDGPKRHQLQHIVRQQNIEASVRFSGWVDHREVQYRLAEADLLLFPSIRDFGGGVVLEAMAVGTLPVVVNYGGPGELVTPKTGFSVRIGRRKEIVTGLRDVLRLVVARPEILEEKSPAACQRVNTLFTWDAKAQQVLSVYESVLR